MMSFLPKFLQMLVLLGFCIWPAVGAAEKQAPIPDAKTAIDGKSTPSVSADSPATDQKDKPAEPKNAVPAPKTQPAAPAETLAKPPALTAIPADIKIVEKRGAALPLDLVFTDDAGATRTLGSYFDGQQPVVLVPVYYRCPLLCNITLNRMVETLKDLPWTPGDGYRIVAVSVDARETADLAKSKKSVYIKDLGMPGAETGWHFLTGKKPAITALMETVGFGYRYDPDKMEYLHRAALIVITPAGEVYRYFRGAYTPPVQLKLGLLKAADGTLGTMKERLWAGIFTYDTDGRKYRLNETLLLIILGGMVFTVLLLSIVAIRRRRT